MVVVKYRKPLDVGSNHIRRQHQQRLPDAIPALDFPSATVHAKFGILVGEYRRFRSPECMRGLQAMLCVRRSQLSGLHGECDQARCQRQQEKRVAEPVANRHVHPLHSILTRTLPAQNENSRPHELLQSRCSKIRANQLRWADYIPRSPATTAALSFGSFAGCRAAQQMSTTPTTTAAALAICALDKPHRTLGLRRTNSTRKRAIPLSTKYWPTIAPVPCRFPPLHHSQAPISNPAASS